MLNFDRPLSFQISCEFETGLLDFYRVTNCNEDDVSPTKNSKIQGL